MLSSVSSGWSTVFGLTLMKPRSGVYTHKLRVASMSGGGPSGIIAVGVCAPSHTTSRLVGHEPGSASNISLGDVYAKGSRQRSGLRFQQNDKVGHTAICLYRFPWRVSLFLSARTRWMPWRVSRWRFALTPLQCQCGSLLSHRAQAGAPLPPPPSP